MGKILKGIDGERFPIIGNVQKYNVTFVENADTTSIKEEEIVWQLYWSNEDSKYEKVPAATSKPKIGEITTYKFLQNLLNKNLQLKATCKDETVELHITPQSNGEEKIIDVFFLNVEYKSQDKDNLKYLNSLNLQIYTLNMLGKSLDFKIYDTINGEEKEVCKSATSLQIIQNNGIVKTKQSIMLSPVIPMQTQKDMSASEHFYKIKIWETGNEANFYEEQLKVKNETGSFSVAQDSQVPVKTGTSEPVNKKEEEEKKETCGIEYRNTITCTRRITKKATVYGPIYFGNIKMPFYKEWNKLINEGKVTQDEKEIVVVMSQNEGNMDAVQSYDSEIISAGSMQKTITIDGHGELSIQLWEFKEEYPEKYKELFQNCGWSVKEVEEIEKDKNGKERKVIKKKSFYKGISGKELKILIRKNCNEKVYGKKVICIPMEPFINACKDLDFQAKQIEDFIKRLNSSTNKKPNGYNNKIKDFVKSKLGKATVLDHDVNRPGHVSDCFGRSLDKFFQANPEISKDPTQWKDKFNIYELGILKIYGPLRGSKELYDRPMTDAAIRYNNLKTRLGK